MFGMTKLRRDLFAQFNRNQRPTSHDTFSDLHQINDGKFRSG